MRSALFWFLLFASAAWTITALWVQFPSLRLLAIGGYLIALGFVVYLRLGSAWGWAGLFSLTLIVALWYQSLAPRQNRNWAPDVAHIVKGAIAGDRVFLENVRAFRWESADVASVKEWRSRDVDLGDLAGVDMITSSWGNPKIAHLLLSFRFAHAEPITFSVEIRREEGEQFSALGGFFRQFELSLIAADEADILQWRAVPRGEDVELYKLKLSHQQMRQLFLGFVKYGNELNREPVWYNTLTANCATVVWRLASVVSRELPMDVALLLPGLLPEYINRIGALEGHGTLAEKRARAKISERARQMPIGEDFSSYIRR